MKNERIDLMKFQFEQWANSVRPPLAILKKRLAKIYNLLHLVTLLYEITVWTILRAGEIIHLRFNTVLDYGDEEEM